jgi:hypothetical protein
MKTARFRKKNQPTWVGGAPQLGRLQSMPSQSIASCAEVSLRSPVRSRGPRKTATLQDLVVQAKSLPIPVQELHPVAATSSKSEHRAACRFRRSTVWAS